MIILEITIDVSEDRTATVQVPPDTAPGKHNVTMILDPNSEVGASEFELESGAFERRMVWNELQRTRQIQLWDSVALLEEMPAEDVTTGEMLLLRRGQMGRVILTYGSNESQVEFSSRNEHTYARLRIPNDRLMIL
jgi:Domain of unknown function (DUF4926)